MVKSHAALFCFVSTLAMAGGAMAGETATTTADEVTVTATRSAKNVLDAPATVTVITDKAMDDQLVKNVKDLILFEPGVAVPRSPARFTLAGSSTGRNGDSGFNIRGLEGNRVLVMVDGVRIPDSYSFGAQSMGRGDYVDLDTLKSVEIVRGPASALYGSDGLAGSVSFITKDPSDILRPGQTFSLSAKESYASSDDSYAESILAAGRSDKWEGMLAYTRRDGHELETKGSNGSANTDRTKANPEDAESNALLAKVVYRPVEGQRFRLTYDHLDTDSRWNVLSAIAKPPLSSTSTLGLLAHDETTRDRVTLDHRYDGSGWLSSAQTSLYWQNSTTRQYGAEDRNTAVDRTRDSTFDNEVYGAAIELQSHFRTGDLLNHLVYGGDYSLTRQEGIRGGTVPSAGDTFPTRAFPITDYTQAGLYVEDEIVFGPLSLYPVLRWDYYKLSPKSDALYTATSAGQSDNHVSPKLSAVYKVNETVSLFANFAKGFKAPSPSQVNNNFSNPTSFYMSVPNPNLRPETSTTYEAGARFRGPGWSASATAFTGKYSNFIDQIQAGGSFTPTDPAIFQYVNLSSAKISGVEARGDVALGHGFTFQAAASYAHGSSKNSSGVATPLATIEPIKIVGGLGWKEAGGRFGGQLNAVHSDGKEASRSGVSCTPSCFMPSAFTVWDLTAFWNVTPHATLRAGVFNITDQTYYWWSDVRGIASTSTVIEGYSQPGRNVSVSLAYRF